jgi:hypothetical protein
MSGPSFTLTTGPVVSAATALEYFGAALGCTERFHDPESLGSSELRVVTWIDPLEEDPELAAQLGVSEMLVAVFDPRKGLDSDAYARTVFQIVGAAAGFLAAHPGPRAVLDQDTDSRVLLRRGEDGEILLDTYLLDTERMNRTGAFSSLSPRYAVTDLGFLERDLQRSLSGVP